MSIPKLTEQSIIEALKYIDEHGVPWHNESTVYELVVNEKKYPPKYVIGVANHFANGEEISTQGYNAIEAKSFFESRGYTIEVKQSEMDGKVITQTDINYIGVLEYLVKNQEVPYSTPEAPEITQEEMIEIL